MKVLVPIFDLVHGADGPPADAALGLISSLARGFSAQEGFAPFYMTDNSRVAARLREEQDEGCLMFVGKREEGAFLPTGGKEIVEQALNNGFIEHDEPVAVLDYRASLSAGDLAGAVQRQASLDAPLVSISAVRDHPAQLDLHYCLNGGDVVALFDGGGGDSGKAIVSKPFPFSWGAYSVPDGDGFYVRPHGEAGMTSMQRPSAPHGEDDQFEFLGKELARRCMSGTCMEGLEPFSGVSAFRDIRDAATVCTSDGLGVHVWIREDVHRETNEVRCFPVNGDVLSEHYVSSRFTPGRSETTQRLHGKEFFHALTLDGRFDSLVLLFLKRTTGEAMDFREPVDLENPYWEIDPKTHVRKDKQTGQAVTGRQQVPDACKPDRTLAIARPDELLVLGEKLRSGMVHGFRVPSAGMCPQAALCCEEASRADDGGLTPCVPGKGGLADIRESFEKLMKSSGDVSEASIREFETLIRDRVRQAAAGLETIHNIRESALRLERAAGGYRQSFQCIHEGHAKALRQYHAALELEDRFSRFEESRKAEDGLALIESGQRAEGFNFLRDILAASPNSEVATDGLRGLAASDSPEAGEASRLLAEYRCEFVDELSMAFADKALRLAGGNNPPWLFVSDRRDIHRLTLDGEFDKSFGLNLNRPLALWVEEDVLWARDLAEANRCYLAYDFNGNELERIPLTSLVDGEIGNLVPMSMCRAGGRNIYLLTDRQTLRSSIIAHDLETGEKEVLIPDGEECLFSHPYCCGGDLFVSDYFSRTVFRYDSMAGAFEEFFSLPKSEYGVLNSFCCDGERFLLQTNERLSKADADGNILYSIKWSDMVRYDEFKVIGSTLVETGEGVIMYAFDALNRLVYRVLV